MSRSNPTSNNPHPCQRWFEWGGADGVIQFWNKEIKERVIVPLPVTFIWLDETATVRGWHDPSESGIVSNEVRDTRSDVMVVRSFKGGELCHGIYAQIRDRVGNLGGHFSANIYVGFRESPTGPLRLGCIQLKGAALNGWVEFKKANYVALAKGAVTITGFKDGQKGSVKFRTPVFAVKEIRSETNEEATALDVELQKYLLSYFARTKVDQVVATVPAAEPSAPAADTAGTSEPPLAEPEPQPDAPPDNEPW